MLKDKTVFITGATAGFGLATARLLAKHGARIVATGRREDRLFALKQELGDSAHVLALDVRDKDAVYGAFKTLPEAFSKIDILINNAGLALGHMQPFDQLEKDDLAQMVETNIMGVIHCTHAVLPQMTERDSGHIVNLSSIAGSYPYPGGNVYGATKAFLTQFSLNLRADLLGRNIRVTSIEPGMCDTEFSLVRYAGDKSKASEVYEGMTPLSAGDIAQTILWCVTQPRHVNVNRLEVMPVAQAFSPFAVSRNE